MSSTYKTILIRFLTLRTANRHSSYIWYECMFLSHVSLPLVRFPPELVDIISQLQCCLSIRKQLLTTQWKHFKEMISLGTNSLCFP